MQDSARLSDLAAAEIDALIADGIQPTPAEIVHINALAWDIETGETRLALSRGTPVFVGGVTLWPLTLNAYDWSQRALSLSSSKWWGTLSLAYAMAHCYDDAHELASVSLRDVARVLSWGARLKCRISELKEAMAQVIKQDETEEIPLDDDAKAFGLGDLSASLSALTGLPPEQFEKRMAFNHALRIMHFSLKQQAQANGQPQAGTAAINAERAMGLYLINVRKAHTKETTDETK